MKKFVKFEFSIYGLGCWTEPQTENKPTCRRATARRPISAEILLNAAQLYEKSHLKWLAVGEWRESSVHIPVNAGVILDTRVHGSPTMTPVFTAREHG